MGIEQALNSSVPQKSTDTESGSVSTGLGSLIGENSPRDHSNTFAPTDVSTISPGDRARGMGVSPDTRVVGGFELTTFGGRTIANPTPEHLVQMQLMRFGREEDITANDDTQPVVRNRGERLGKIVDFASGRSRLTVPTRRAAIFTAAALAVIAGVAFDASSKSGKVDVNVKPPIPTVTVTKFIAPDGHGPNIDPKFPPPPGLPNGTGVAYTGK